MSSADALDVRRRPGSRAPLERHEPDPLRLARVTVGLRTTDAGVAAPKQATIQGASTVVIPAHAEVTTDAVSIRVNAGDDVVVSFAVVGTATVSEHLLGAATGWCTGPGTGDNTAETEAKAFRGGHREGLVVESIEVHTTTEPRGIVAVGDSMTDPPLPLDTYERWTDVVAARTRRPVANVAIAGNRVVLPGGYGDTLTERFDRDVLQRPGTDTVVLFAGTNDVSVGIPAATLIGRLTQLCGRAHRARLRVVVVTLVPAWRRPTPMEQTRQRVNAWLGTTTIADGHVDADALLRDPARPSHLLAAYDLGDGLHLSTAGERALGGAIATALPS